MKYLKQIKSTILGIIINGFVFMWLFKNYETLHEIPADGYALPVLLLAIGTTILFAPDKVIDAFISYFNKKKE